MPLHFTIPGEPRAKGRPRFGRTKAGHAVAFTDRQTASYENLVKLAAQQAMRAAGLSAPMDGPLSLHITVRLVPPASESAKRKALMLAGELFPAKRPDLDNYAKAALDGCNAVVFGDDAQVVRLSAAKVYAATAGMDVSVCPALPTTALARAA